MSRGIFGILGFVAALAFVQGCSMPDAAPVPEAAVQTHFIPFNNGLVYTFQQYNNHSIDTIQWRIIIGRPGSPNVLVNAKTLDTIYRIGLTHDANGNLAAMMSNDSGNLMVLDGKLEQGATWIADEVHGIRATVVDQYDNFYLEGRSTSFSDVLVVQYYQEGQPLSSYTLRFFARDHGLISERELASGTEISSLQLISISGQ